VNEPYDVKPSDLAIIRVAIPLTSIEMGEKA
jgi:hypothetical protein